MRETATTDSVIDDMRALVCRIEQAIKDRSADTTGLNLFVAKNDLQRCVYAHEVGLRFGELLRQCDDFGKPPA